MRTVHVRPWEPEIHADGPEHEALLGSVHSPSSVGVLSLPGLPATVVSSDARLDSALPLSVLALVLTFVDGRCLAMCERASRTVFAAVSGSGLWHRALLLEFGVTSLPFTSWFTHAATTGSWTAEDQRSPTRLATKARFAGSTLHGTTAADARAAFGRRVVAARARVVRRATQTSLEAQKMQEYLRLVRVAKGLTYGFSFPAHVALYWTMFAFMLLASLKLDGKIAMSWWAVCAPVYMSLFLFSSCGLGVCIVRMVRCHVCLVFNSQISSVLDFGPEFSREVASSKWNVATVGVGLAMVASFGAWFVAIAAKMERVWDVPWVLVCLPLWVSYGFATLYVAGTAMMRKRWHSLMMAGTIAWTLLVIPGCVARADGRHVALLYLFMPEFVGAGGVLVLIVGSLVYSYVRWVRVRGRGQLWMDLRVVMEGSAFTMMFLTPVTVAVALVVTNDAGASHVPWTTVMALPLCLTGVLGLAWTINHVTYFLSMYSRILPGMRLLQNSRNDTLVFERGDSPMAAPRLLGGPVAPRLEIAPRPLVAQVVPAPR